MIYRSKAPLRIGLAGGGTDVSPYSEMFGAAILNATVNLYAYANLEKTNNDTILIQATDRNEEESFPSNQSLPITGLLDLHKAVYNRMKSEFGLKENGLKLTTSVDVPAGSGLGTSSTLVVAITGVFAEMMNLPLPKYQLAKLAFDIERKDLGMAGGRQDQYAAAFGGFNFMEFGADNASVTPLDIKQTTIELLEKNLLLYYTSTSRDSTKIIERQSTNVTNGAITAIESMHQLKQQAIRMKAALENDDPDKIGALLDFGFTHKKRMAEGITNQLIEDIYQTARAAGATGGKISGAGGGGFMTFYCPDETKTQVERALIKYGGHGQPFRFTKDAMTSWTENIQP